MLTLLFLLLFVKLVIHTVTLLITGTRIYGCVLRQKDNIETTMKKIEITATALAAFDEYGSSNSCQSLGCNRLYHGNSPLTYLDSSSQPNFLAISSSLNFSVSKSRRSSTANVSCVSRCCVYVIQQHGST